MKGFSIVTDSGYSLPAELSLLDVDVVDISIIIDDEVIPSSKINPLEVINLLLEGKNITTSAPSVGDWLDVFRSSKEPIVAITISSRLSASYNNALIASRMCKKRVYVVDSLSASIGQGLVVYHAMLLSEKGQEVEGAVTSLREIAEKTRVYLSVGSMEYLAKSGRVPWFVGKMGEFLHYHPILEVSDGVIKRHSMVRGDPSKHLANIGNPQNPVIVGYVNPLPEKDNLVNLLKERGLDVYETYTSPEIAVHVGPDSFGWSFVGTEG